MTEAKLSSHISNTGQYTAKSFTSKKEEKFFENYVAPLQGEGHLKIK